MSLYFRNLTNIIITFYNQKLVMFITNIVAYFNLRYSLRCDGLHTAPLHYCIIAQL